MAHQAFIASKLPGQLYPNFLKGVVEKYDNYLFNSKVFIIKEFEINRQSLVVENLTETTFDEFVLYKNSDIKQSNSFEQYQETFQSIYNTFSDNLNLKKVVLSRTQFLKKELNIYQYFYDLCEAFPECFVVLFSSPLTGTWIGCSPEVLLKSDQFSFIIMALAGTKIAENNIEWGSKEKEEQLYVVDYIYEYLNRKGVSFKTQNKDLQMGKVKHRLTTFKSNDVYNIWKDLYDFLIELSPTPAVCGFPKELSFQVIQSNEKHLRNLYTGFWGFVDLENKQTDIYVNLRCAQLLNDGILFYAGGGITKDSIESSEWQETNQKIELLTQFIH